MKTPAWRMLFVCLGVVSTFGSTGGYSHAAEPQAEPYRIGASVAGGDADGVWDYATVDAAARRLYLAQDGVTALDLDTGKVTPHFVTGQPLRGPSPAHQVLPVNGGKAMAVSVVATNSVDFFDPQTGKIFSVVKVGPPPKENWHNPDGLLYEPKSKRLIAVEGDRSSLALVDTRTFAAAGEIRIGKGKLETAVADGGGLVYVNEEEGGRIAVVNVARRKVVRQIAMKDCEEPTGLVYDAKDRLVISVCSNGWVKFIAPASGKEVASVKVGPGADALVYDPQHRVVFSFGGDDGTLSIIAVHGRRDIALAQTLKTQPGARLGALDPKTGRVYIPSASFGPPAAPMTLPGLGTIPGLNPHTFTFLVVEPTSQ